MATESEIQAFRARNFADFHSLNRAHIRHLREMAYQKAFHQISSLEMSPIPRQRPGWSGLVEQQRLFHKARDLAAKPKSP